MKIRSYSSLHLLIKLIFLTSEVMGLISVDKELPCAVGISTIPPLDQLGLPEDRFPQSIPSGVGLCDASCGQSSVCTYNWADSLSGFPFLLFKCQCPNTSNTCPPEKILYAGYLKIFCEDVTNLPSRCVCPQTKSAFRCTIAILPVQTKNSYYCVCCNLSNGT